MIVELIMTLSLACPGEYESTLGAGRELLYAGKYEEAERIALEARSICPNDPESFELRSTALILRVKEVARGHVRRKNEDVSPRVKRCPECAPLLRTISEEVERGVDLAAQILGMTEDERAEFLLARLELNRVWSYLELEGRHLASKGPFTRAYELLRKVLAGNPRHVRSLVAMAGVNYVLDRKIPWYAKPFLPDGSRHLAFRDLATATALAGTASEEWEAKFVLWSILTEEKGRRAEADALAEQLRSRFPDNPSFRVASP